MIGIEFTFKDGKKDWYDPIDYPSDFEETDTHYVLKMAYTYEIEKATVESIRHYELCKVCGHELFEDGCRRYHPKGMPEALRQLDLQRIEQGRP